MTPLDDVRNEVLRLALRLRQAEDEESQAKYDLSASLLWWPLRLMNSS